MDGRGFGRARSVFADRLRPTFLTDKTKPSSLTCINASGRLTSEHPGIRRNRRTAMARFMKAAVVRELGRPLVVDEIPVPTPGPGEVLVKIVATGVCHTDLHAAEGDWPVKPAVPFVPGHEGAGVVAAVGPGVTRLKEGDPVGIA